MKIIWMWALVCLPLGAQQARTLTLKEAEQIALRNHPRIRGADLRAQAGKAAEEQARAGFYPQLNGAITATGAQRETRLSAGVLQDSSLSSRAAGGVSVSQLLTDFGRTSKLVASADSNTRSLKEETVFHRGRVLLHVREFFLRALLAQSVLESAKKNLETRQLTARQITRLAESNLRSSLDVSFAEVNVSEAELLVVRAENELAGALSQLSAAMGEETVQSYTLVPESSPGAPEFSAEPLLRKAKENRRDLAALRLRQEGAARFAEAEKRLKLPVVSVIGAAGLVPIGEKRLPSTYSGAGLNVSIPLFNGRLFSARHTEALLRSEAAGAEVREMEIRVANAVRMAWLNTQTAYRRLAVTRRLAEQAQRSLRLAKTRYDLGLSSIIELSQAQLNLTNAEIADAAAGYEYQLQLAALDFETGVLR